MDNNVEKKNTNKVIYLEEKKKQLNEINTSISNKTKSSIYSNKIIYYRISKKKKKTKSLYFNNRHIMLIILIISILCFVSCGIKNNLPYSRNKPNDFASIDPSIEKDDFDRYSMLISTSVTRFLELPNNSTIVSETMHKNGTKILAQGYFYFKENSRIYFDILLDSNRPISLLVNGREYVK